MVKRILAVLIGVVCLVGVSGCGGNPSVAADVNGHVITEAQVDQAVEAMRDLASQIGSELNLTSLRVTMLQHCIVGAVLNQTLAQVGVTITDEERNEVWEQNFGPMSSNGIQTEYPLWKDPRSREAISGFIDLNLVSWMVQGGQLDGVALTDIIEQIPLTINPRYGEFDSQSLTLSVSGGKPAGSLAKPLFDTQPS